MPTPPASPRRTQLSPPGRPCFDNSYARLPERFYARVSPTSARAPTLIRANSALAVELGLDPEWLLSPEGIAFLTGKEVIEGSDPIAMAYAGHQFGQFVPQLGDGRAILLAEVIDSKGNRQDIHSKVLDEPLSRAAATAMLHLVRCYASTSSARPWRHLVSPQLAPWQRPLPAKE